MNMKKIIIASVAGFIFVFIFEMLWHGFLMKGMYEATSDVWRPEADGNMIVMMFSQFLFALSMTVFWVKVGRLGPCKKGLAFGVLAGCIMASPELATFCYLPIPVTISLLWMVATVLKATATGMIIAKLYND